MATMFGTAFVWAVAVFFLGMGSYALAAPAAMLRPFGIALGRSESRSEVRAVYGGFGLAIAGALGFAAVHSGDLRSGILITVGAALAGMALGRLLSAVVDTAPAFYPNWLYCLVEIVGAAGLFAAVATS